MLERLYRRALEDELEQLRAEPARLELFLRTQNDFSAREADAVRTFFLSKGAQVIINYPRAKEATFPLYAIILAEERETQPFLGDSLGVLDSAGAETLGDLSLVGSEMLGYIQHHRHHVMVMCEDNPDLTLYYYQIAKSAFLRRANALKAAGLLSLRFSGRDFGPHPDYAPNHIFMRQLTIESETLFSVVGDIPSDYVTSVDGIYVRDEPPVVGINALVNVTDLLDSENEDGNDGDDA